ncbi:hypothetical protein Q7A53_18400 [Halobacillus rhizosphaerae]|uniref:hypothetical protein n=1 Tax=Halobacillus rhizosphaerae TaxID=3064889 RepID=UPI00398AFD80
MRKLTKWVLIILGCILSVIGFIVISFIVEMTPDKDKEEKVKAKAEEYIESEFSGQMEIFDTLYDNMGNFNGFEYAAKVENKDTDVQFLVYEQESSGAMADDYAVSFYEKTLHDLIIDDIEKMFDHPEMVTVDYEQTKIARKYIGETDIPDIRELNVSPSLVIWMDRGRESADEEKTKELIEILKKEKKIPHVGLKVDYINMGGENIVKNY